jgi:serine/threonine-protein phosphatase PGAM5
VPTTRLYLVRHGEARGHDEASGLTPRGQDQASRLGQRLRGLPVTAVHHSPLARADETAQIVAGFLPGVPVTASEHLIDRTPAPSAATRADYPQPWWPLLDSVTPPERDEDAVALRQAVAHFDVVGGDDRNDVLISHNFVLGWFVRHVLDAPDWRWIGLNHANCGLSILQWETGRPPVLVAFNDTGHLLA